MDYGEMIRSHIEREADLTIGCIAVPRKDGGHFGILNADKTERVVGFVEKPADPPALPEAPNECLASMGIYVFTARIMYDLLFLDAGRQDSEHDFGKSLIPSILKTHKVYAYRFRAQNRKAEPYWPDVGTLHPYYQADTDLLKVTLFFNL